MTVSAAFRPRRRATGHPALAAGLVVLVAVAAVAVAAAATPGDHFVYVTGHGSSQALDPVGFTFGTIAPPIGKRGTIEVDCKVTNEPALKKVLVPGTTLTSSELDISAVLPRPQHFAYRFANPKVTSITFVRGNFGLVAAIKLSFTKLSKQQL